MMKFHRVSVILVALVAISGVAAGVGSAAQDDTSTQPDRETLTDFPKNGSQPVADTATGHGDDVKGTVTMGDRDAHNVEINATVRDRTDNGDSETLPGVTNVAAGTNLTVATGHGDAVTEVAITYENSANTTVAAPDHDERRR